MTTSKRPDDDAQAQRQQGQPPQPPASGPPDANQPQAGQGTYQTPQLDPRTGAPLDTRFQKGASQEETASKQSPKSGSPASAQTKGKGNEDDEEDKAKNKAQERQGGRR